jgi:hypothetical protein
MTKKLPFQAWLEREIENYMAQSGAIKEDSRSHVMDLIKANPDLARQMVDDFFTEFLREKVHH